VPVGACEQSKAIGAAAKKLKRLALVRPDSKL
jgi:hypothetical protein